MCAALPPPPHPTLLGHHRAPSWASVPQQASHYLFYAQLCIHANAAFSVRLCLYLWAVVRCHSLSCVRVQRSGGQWCTGLTGLRPNCRCSMTLWSPAEACTVPHLGKNWGGGSQRSRCHFSLQVLTRAALPINSPKGTILSSLCPFGTGPGPHSEQFSNIHAKLAA